MNLGQDTGQTNARRDQEATQILEMFLQSPDIDMIRKQFSTKELDFINSLEVMYKRTRSSGKSQIFVSGKQLFWLRDLKEKYL